MKKKDVAWLNWYNGLLFSASATLFGSLLILDRQTDVQLHMRFLQEFIWGERAFPPNFVYYCLVLVLSFFQNNLQVFYIASTLILATSVTAKFILTKQFISNQMTGDCKKTFTRVIPNCISVCLLFAFSIPWPQFHSYLGQIPSNVWHNPTTILLMPFALGLFLTSIKQLDQSKNERIKWVCYLVLLNIFIKPSFFFVFSVAYPIFLYCKFKFTISFWKNLIPIVAGILGVMTVYYFVYETQPKVKVGIHPLAVWNLYTRNIFGSLVLSLVFPATYLFLYWKTLFKERTIQFAIILFLGAILIFSLFSEEGRESEGNFFWQCIVTSYLLFMALSADLAKRLCEEKIDWKIILVCICLGTHALSGIAYLIRFFILGTYF